MLEFHVQFTQMIVYHLLLVFDGCVFKNRCLQLHVYGCDAFVDSQRLGQVLLIMHRQHLLHSVAELGYFKFLASASLLETLYAQLIGLVLSISSLHLILARVNEAAHGVRVVLDLRLVADEVRLELKERLLEFFEALLAASQVVDVGFSFRDTTLGVLELT